MTLVIAHRGASADELENTLAAFARARAMQADGVELDVHLTADDVIVVHHDATIDGQPIAAMTGRAVQQHRLDNGEAVPTLHEALDCVSDTEAFIEVKDLPPRGDRVLFAAMDASFPERRAVHSFDHRIIARLKRQQPSRRYGVLSSSYLLDPLAANHATGADTLWQHESMIDRELAAMAARDHITLIAWTVDDPRRMAELAAWGVHGICTNRPDVAREIFA